MIDLTPSRNLAVRPRAASSVWLLSLIVCCTLACLSTRAVTLYVWQDSPSPSPPYTDWFNAATNIQDAMDVAQAGDTVLVTNGAYASGGRAVGTNVLVNRVVVDKPITLQSVNGPQVTIIEGGQAPSGGNGDGAIRCVYLTSGAVLSGFTLTNGATLTNGDSILEQSGGGVWCETNAAVTNCTLIGNSANNAGGGAYYGTLNNCTLTNNSSKVGGGASGGTLINCTLTGNRASSGGGAASSALNNCTLTGNSANGGGGAFSSTLNNCTLTINSASSGGGANGSRLNNCTLNENSAGSYGGGAYGGTLNNCTLTTNSAHYGGGASEAALNNCTLTGNEAVNGDFGGTSFGGGVYFGTLNNCTLTGNSSYEGEGAYGSRLYNCIVYNDSVGGGTMNFCCASFPPDSFGIGNITNAPLFVDLLGGNLHLQTNSPCINAGDNTYVTTATDLDGNPRIVSGTVDIGAYEYQGAGSVISYAWLQQYGLPTDGSADYTDPDHDGMNNWQEWVADTNPTNAASVLRLTIFSNRPPVAVTFSSSAARLYTLLSCSNLTPSSVWTPVPGQTDKLGNGAVLTLTDTNPPAPAIYRVSVRLP
jgi:hypothetical protein